MITEMMHPASAAAIGASAPMDPVIQVNDLHKSYGSVDVLKGCDLTIQRGEVAVICGPSGSGKSTLIKCLNALEPFQRGSVTVQGIDVRQKASQERLRRQVGMVFQHFELYPHLNVIDNLCLAQVCVLKRSREEAERRAVALLDRVGLPSKSHALPAQLSGGQQQRIAIARALAMDPAAVLFDEPTSALDPEMIGEVLAVMLELAQDGMTMVVVTHEMGFARRAADHMIFMDQGTVVEDVSAERFFESAQSTRAREFLSRIMAH